MVKSMLSPHDVDCCHEEECCDLSYEKCLSCKNNKEVKDESNTKHSYFVAAHTEQERLEKCSNCNSPNHMISHVVGTHKYFVECADCHRCGKTKIFKCRAIKSWNLECSKLRNLHSRKEW